MREETKTKGKIKVNKGGRVQLKKKEIYSPTHAHREGKRGREGEKER